MKNSVSTIVGVLLLTAAMAFRLPGQPVPSRVNDVSTTRVEALKNLHFGMFVCWSFSTFSGREWTPGVTNIDLFAAKACDTDQWAKTAKEAGMSYVLFLTKHHDGFCLWDTRTTDRKVTRSPLRRDVLAALRKSCDKYGLKLALYFSEGEWQWPDFPDGRARRNHGGANPEMKKAQLKELLTQYGPIEYLWFDYAVGDGGLSHADTVAFVKSLQPDCFVGFNNGDQEGADIRLGEEGHPGSLADQSAAGRHMDHAAANTYRLAEFTYPILPPHQGGAMWFYSLPRHDQLCLPAAKIYADYQGAVKFGNLFSLDVGPDYRGRLRDIDVQTLRQVGRYIRGEDTAPPLPFGPVPTERQLAWHQLEYYGFIHFTVNTFTDKEWGFGDEPESVFNPTDFSAAQIVQTAKDAGMKGLIVTAKHHDGFCLWPSRFTEHSVKHSPWQNGRGDFVREMSDACRRAGLKFGIYLSPWDRNRADYGTPEYLSYYRNQLRELLTNYGPVSEIWFDGANGGDGFYGGAKEKRTIDRKTYYDWTKTRALVRDLMPGAMMFSDGGPDVRWVGNERGVAGDPCWATLNRADFYPGEANQQRLNSGDRPGTDWIPAECDVSIRPGWFYHAQEDAKVKTPAQLVDLYFKSVGRGASFLLNLPPDRRGRIADADVRSLREFHRQMQAVFSKNLAAGAAITASNVRGGSHKYSAQNVLAGDNEKYWCTDDHVTTPELVLDLGRPKTFNIVSLREFLPLGQRVEAFALDQWLAGQWVPFASGTSIGSHRLIRGDFATTSKLRLRITQAPVCPALAEIGLFAEPAKSAGKK
ncbi:MAG: alpha-L-fucosidase [Verrucomicrobiota bacterium]